MLDGLDVLASAEAVRPFKGLGVGLLARLTFLVRSVWLIERSKLIYDWLPTREVLRNPESRGSTQLVGICSTKSGLHRYTS